MLRRAAAASNAAGSGPSPSRPIPFARLALLPLVLVLGTVVGLGTYCEASDDTSLAWLFSGVLATGPVPSVPLYFHGYGHVLALLYKVKPEVPWFGLLLGGGLGTATVFVFAVLDRLLRPHLRPLALGLALAGFFAVGWLEHWLLFSYVRVAVLLAGAAVLFAAQRPGRWVALVGGLTGLGAAWLMRPSLALLGFGAVMPAALLLAGRWRRAAPVLLGGVLLLSLASTVAAGLRTPAQARTQALDGYLARVLDFNQLEPAPRTAADSLGVTATRLWLLGDSTATNPALYRRVYRFDAGNFFDYTVPAKLRARLPLLGRDYFPLLLALAASWALWPRRRGGNGWFWWVQVGFAGALLAIAGVLKLPPRLALPLLDFWVLNNLVFLLKNPPAESWLPALGLRRARRYVLGAVVVLVFGAYAAKTLHRRRVLGQGQARHAHTLAELARRTAGQVRVMAGTADLLKSLSPFRTYAPGPGPVLALSGWPAHDASQRALCRALTGAPGQADALRRLARRPLGSVAWVLAVPEAAWLGAAAHRAPASERWALRPGPALATDSTLRFYYPAP